MSLDEQKLLLSRQNILYALDIILHTYDTVLLRDRTKDYRCDKTKISLLVACGDR